MTENNFIKQQALTAELREKLTAAEAFSHSQENEVALLRQSINTLETTFSKLNQTKHDLEFETATQTTNNLQLQQEITSLRTELDLKMDEMNQLCVVYLE